MKLAGSARHLEGQLFADQYWDAISLFGSDCSVQRRHQEIIEETPVTIAKRERFEEMERAAVRRRACWICERWEGRMSVHPFV